MKLLSKFKIIIYKFKILLYGYYIWYRQFESYVGPQRAAQAFTFRYRKLKLYTFNIYY